MNTGRSLILLSVLVAVGAFCLVCLGEPTEAAPSDVVAGGEAIEPEPGVALASYQREALVEVVAADATSVDEPVDAQVLDTQEELLPELAGGATIDGTVRDAGGAPVEGAHVWIVTSSDDVDQPEAQTDEQGAYQITIVGAPLRDVRVACQAEKQQASVVGPFDVLAGDRRRVEFSLPAALVVHGSVIDALTEQPVAGASIELHSKLEGFGEGGKATSSADGSFTLDSAGLAAHDLVIQVIGGENHGSAQVELTAAEDSVVVRVGPMVELEGMVIDAVSQQPLFNVPVRLASGLRADAAATGDEAFTSREGKFTMRLRHVTLDDATLVVDAPGHQLLRVALADVADSVRGSARRFAVRLPLRAP